MKAEDLKPNKILRGPIFPEPVQIIVCIPMGDAVKLVGKGVNTSKVYEPVLTPDQLATLETTPDTEPFDGDPLRFRLAVEAMRLALAFEYDPYFSLSIARVDPLPHQLEAVYQYFMALPRIRFLLADDPGAGKTIMAGLLLKELKIRGLVKRTLIITPANLSFQWQREMKDKFRENFEIIRSDVLRANYGANPWQDKNQVITSVSWVSRIEDAKESLLRSHWDLIIVDEAHKMSAASRDKTTLAYDLGAELSKMTDHYLLMTATPHKGDPENFCLFLELLDRDVYGDVKSLEEAMKKQEAPFYLRRVKEALVSFPDPETGKVKALFTKRVVRTTEFKINLDELDFYDALTRFVEDQSIKAASEDSARGRALEGYLGSAGPVVLGAEIAAGGGNDPKGGEKVRFHLDTGDVQRRCFAEIAVPAGIHRGHGGKHALLLAPVQVSIADIEFIGVDGPAQADRHQPVGVGVREAAEQQQIHHAEDSGGSADANRQRCYRRQAEGGRAADHAQAVTRILRQRVQPAARCTARTPSRRVGGCRNRARRGRGPHPPQRPAPDARRRAWRGGFRFPPPARRNRGGRARDVLDQLAEPAIDEGQAPFWVRHEPRLGEQRI